jgi:hypothetical protein
MKIATAIAGADSAFHRRDKVKLLAINDLYSQAHAADNRNTC